MTLNLCRSGVWQGARRRYQRLPVAFGSRVVNPAAANAIRRTVPDVTLQHPAMIVANKRLRNVRPTR
jgi:hypothetical protein